MFTKGNPSDTGCGRREVAAHFAWGARFHVPQIDVRRPAEQKEEDAGVLFAARVGDVGPQPREVGGRQPQQRERTGSQKFATPRPGMQRKGSEWIQDNTPRT